jgi:hypothetical protein
MNPMSISCLISRCKAPWPARPRSDELPQVERFGGMAEEQGEQGEQGAAGAAKESAVGYRVRTHKGYGCTLFRYPLRSPIAVTFHHPHVLTSGEVRLDCSIRADR